MNSWLKTSLLFLLMVTRAWNLAIKTSPAHFTSRSFHPQLKLTVNSNPNALTRKGLFPDDDVEWVPLDPMEYKNASGSQESIERNRKNLHRRSNLTNYSTNTLTTSTPIQTTSSIPEFKSSGVLWINKLTSNVGKQTAPKRKFNTQARIAVENRFHVKSEKKSNVSQISLKDLPVKRKWVPLVVSIPPNMTTTTAKNKIKEQKNAVPQNGFKNSYYEFGNEIIPIDFPLGVVPHFRPDQPFMFPPAPAPVPRPTATQSPFSYVTYSWSTNGLSEAPVKKQTSTIPNTTFKVTAHPLFITTQHASNELSLSGHAGNVNLSVFENSEDFEDSEEISTTTKKKPHVHSKTTPNPILNNERNYYTTLSNQYVDYNYYGASAYPTQSPAYNDHNSVNDLASFLVTISPEDIHQVQAASATKKPTKKPSRGWGLNRLQRLLLAVGMSFIPTAAMAVLVGFPGLLAGRKKRESTQQRSIYEVLRKIQNLDKKHQELWMKNADSVLQSYCAQFSISNQKKKALRGNRAWNDVNQVLTNFIKLYWSESEDTNEHNGSDGVIYIPITSGSLLNTSNTKRRGNAAKVNYNLLNDKVNKSSINWDHFVCKHFNAFINNSTRKYNRNPSGMKRNKSLVKNRQVNSKFAGDQFRHEAKQMSFSDNSQQPITMIIIKKPTITAIPKPSVGKETKYSELPLDNEKSSPKNFAIFNTLPVEHKSLPMKLRRWRRNVASLNDLNSKLKSVGLRMKIISAVSKVKNNTSKVIKSLPLSGRLPAESKIYIYHVVSNRKANGTNNNTVPDVGNTTKPELTTKSAPKQTKVPKQTTKFDLPTIFRIPIAVEDSPTEYMHVLGKPIPWPLVNKIPENYNPEEFWNNKVKPSTTTAGSAVRTNASAPTTINIYSFNGLESDLLTKLLNNFNNKPVEETNEDYEDLPIVATTTKRPRKPTRRPLRVTTYRSRPVTIRAGINIRPPPGRPQPQVVDECDPEIEDCDPDPFIPSLPPTRRPSVTKKPINTVISTLEYLLRKLGLHGGLVPLVDLGNLSKITNKLGPWLWKKRTIPSIERDLKFLSEKPDNLGLLGGKREINANNAENVIRNLLYKEIASLIFNVGRKKRVDNNLTISNKKLNKISDKY